MSVSPYSQILPLNTKLKLIEIIKPQLHYFKLLSYMGKQIMRNTEMLDQYPNKC